MPTQSLGILSLKVKVVVEKDVHTALNLNWLNLNWLSIEHGHGHVIGRNDPVAHFQTQLETSSKTCWIAFFNVLAIARAIQL
jgi:hypothetical protein